MKLKHIIPIALMMVLSITTALQAQSLKIETHDNQKFIIHTVQSGETFWRITQTYNVSEEDIFKYNPAIDRKTKGLKSGGDIKIPYTDPKLQSANTTLEATNTLTKHTVKKGEWLTKIAKKYEVSVEELKKWNALENEIITPGQELIVGIGKSKAPTRTKTSQTTVAKNDNNPNKANTNKTQTLKTAAPDDLVIHTVEKGQTLFRLTQIYKVKADEIKQWNGMTEDGLKEGQKVKIYSKNATLAATTTNTNTTQQGTQGNTNLGFQGLQNGNTTQQGTQGNTNLGFQGLQSGNTTQQTNTNGVIFTTPTLPIHTQSLVPPTPVKISQGTTITTLQNKYNVRKTDIRYWNGMPANSDALREGQVMQIYEPRMLFHPVQAGETIQGIAQKYDVDVVQIEIWNKVKRGTGATTLMNPGRNLAIYQRTGPKFTPEFKEAYTKNIPMVANTSLFTVNPNRDMVQNNNQYQNNNTMGQTQQQNFNTNQGFNGLQSNQTNNNFGFSGLQNQNTQSNNNLGLNNQQNNLGQNNTQTAGGYQTYTVQQGEYLFNVAQRFNVNISEIREWNQLPEGVNPAPGSVLRIYQTNTANNNDPQGNNGNGINNNGASRGDNNNNNMNNSNTGVVNPYANPYQTTTSYGNTNTNTQPNNNNNLQGNNNAGNNYNSSLGTNGSSSQTNFGNSGYTSNTDQYMQNYGSNTAGSTNIGTDMTEKGFADVTPIPSSKTFAVLHRTAPVGTLINIKNPINGNICAAEVVAKINPNTAKAGVIVEVSQAVFTRLGAMPGQLLRVELSYLLQQKR